MFSEKSATFFVKKPESDTFAVPKNGFAPQNGQTESASDTKPEGIGSALKQGLRELRMDAISILGKHRGVAERSNAAVLKTVELQGSGGSNPSSSAITKKLAVR